MIPTSVYVHFPWCERKCPYCDFATSPKAKDEIPHEAYADAVLRELDARRGDLAGRALVSVFFGGGTPSLWAASSLGRVLAAIRDAFPAIAPDAEITAECNPASLTAEVASGFVDAGIDRFSVGVQSLSAEHLKHLGRLHDGAMALRALDTAVSTGARVSADLIFGMPGQTPEALKAEIDAVVARGVEHVSAYALTIEPATVFGALHRKGKLPVAPDDDYATLYLAAEAAFAAHGMDHYEVSNYARPGAESRHNAHYWRGGDYLGLGAAAVGALRSAPGVGRRYRNAPLPNDYLAGAPEAESESLDGVTMHQEAMMLGLRTREGIEVARAEAQAGLPIAQGREKALARALQEGNLVREGDLLRVPRSRWLHLDGIVAALF